MALLNGINPGLVKLKITAVSSDCLFHGVNKMIVFSLKSFK
jgi:hypothetical protein